MSRLAMTLLSIALLLSPAYVAAGLIRLPSAHSTPMTIDRLEARAQAHGLKVFARIDHAAGAHSIGQLLRPTELLIFGHPKGGTPLLQCEQTYGIELPLHVLAWEDVTGKIWLAYKDLANIGHTRVDKNCDAAIRRLTDVLDSLVREAAGQ